ncbi:hypothetical protein Hdeb2414_s0007g00251911 [Helianthus debilis subsp. tardiflorus]
MLLRPLMQRARVTTYRCFVYLIVQVTQAAKVQIVKERICTFIKKRKVGQREDHRRRERGYLSTTAASVVAVVRTSCRFVWWLASWS